MTNPYIEYYANQAGTGLTPFEGYQYQRGHGFFGSLFKNILMPLGRYLGGQALSTGINVGKDILQGENLKESLIKNAKASSKNIFNDAITRAQKFAQTGSGKRRKTKQSKIKSIKRKVKAGVKTVSRKDLKRKPSSKSVKFTKFSHLFQ